MKKNDKPQTPKTDTAAIEVPKIDPKLIRTGLKAGWPAPNMVKVG